MTTLTKQGKGVGSDNQRRLAMIVTCPCQHCGQHLYFEQRHRGTAIICEQCQGTTTPSAATKVVIRTGTQDTTTVSSTDVKNIAITPRKLPLPPWVWRMLLPITFVCLLWIARSTVEESPTLTVVSALGLGLYFMPSLVSLRKSNFGNIFVLNLLLGWTFVGWVGSPAWAMAKDEEA